MPDPTSPSEDFALLIKLLKLTTSSNDAEALSAMRKANAQLRKLGWEWEKLLAGKVRIIGDPFAASNLATPLKPKAAPPPRPTQTPHRPQAQAHPPPPPRVRLQHVIITARYARHCDCCGNFYQAGGTAIAVKDPNDILQSGFAPDWTGWKSFCDQTCFVEWKKNGFKPSTSPTWKQMRKTATRTAGINDLD